MSGTRLRTTISKLPFAKNVWYLGKRWTALLEVLFSYLYDARRYTRWWHGMGADRTRSQRERALLKAYHVIEKGLSLPQPRPAFGQDKIRYIIAQTDAWLAQYGPTGAGAASLSALQAYQAFNKMHGIELEFLDSWLADKETTAFQGGVKPISREEILTQIEAGPDAFFASRHSIRNFGGGEVPIEDVRRAVHMASKTPSVCNRQGPRVHCFENAMEALRWQPGNKGFGDLASRGLVVTADLQAFSGVGERNQCWIDGGLFAMSLIYAFHSLGYGTCALAWSQPAKEDREMRQALDIPDNEVVIMMIAVGSLPETLNVAIAERLDVSNFLVERSGS
jgi:nitroreductase